MSQSIKLTAEEIALIEQKRAEEKAIQEALLKSYDHYRERKIASHKETIVRQEKDEEQRKENFETIFNKLIAVSNDFRFDCTKKKTVTTVDLFELNENGDEIRYNADFSKHIKPKEVVKLDSYYYEMKIVYTGIVPEKHEYYVVPTSTYSKYSYRITGYKMQVQGTGVNSWDKRGQMTNAKTVHKKILEIVENKFRQIEYQKELDSSNKRVVDRFNIEFSKFVKNVTSIDKNTFNIKLDNGITIEIYGYENGDGDITFRKGKIAFPYQMDITSLISNLNDIKGEE
jgi:hypothetical protein